MAFIRADTNGDGKLSKAEAARLPAMAAKFDSDPEAVNQQ